MSTVASIKTEINGLISSANSATSKADTTLHNAVWSLIDGYKPQYNSISGSWTPASNTLQFSVRNLPFKPKTMCMICATTYLSTSPDHIVCFVFDTAETILPLMGVGIDEGTRKVFTYGAASFRNYFQITDTGVSINLTGSEYSTAFLGGHTYKYIISPN